LGGKDFTPMAILNRAIEKYKVVNPETGETVNTKANVKVGKKKLAEDWEDIAEKVIVPKGRVEKRRKSTKRSNSSKKRKA